ncbi:ATP-dependent DNA helicase [Buchananella hordeovulneris]|uniref:ATP-dependent DNA helicase n=1 Tax=Buchananella hordeovulneris TaxID=52770 RepID=UPI0026DB4C2A|nr:ATP-dependent DNA helicase [Buchananella hordeovulneris]MDO5080944.1 ATP-dependent DNA helicase [Buchananella hordeovulneris]
MSGDAAAASLEILRHTVAQLGGAPRAGQAAMVDAVAAHLEAGSHLLVQAGTGTGKSIGYLAPVMAYTARTGRRVVISTATLPLQRQILRKDAPQVAAATEQVLGTAPTFAVLKGWANYVCRYKVTEAATPDSLFSVGEASGIAEGQGARSELEEQVLRAREWAATTSTGDRDDMVPGVSDRAWAQVSMDRARCLKRACPYLADCFAETARATAFAADVVVTNHAMLAVVAGGNSAALPEHDVLIVDEAHDLVERVRSHNTFTLSGPAVARVVATARRGGGAQVGALEEAGRGLENELWQIDDGRLPDGPGPQLVQALTLVRTAAVTALETCRKPSPGMTTDEVAKATAAAAALTDLVTATEHALSPAIAERREVAYVERPNFGQEPPQLVICPIEVGDKVAFELLQERAAVLTSATLSLGGNFAAVAASLGLGLTEQPWQSLDVGSPFDYARQGICYLAPHLPAPTKDCTSPQLLDELVELIEASQGGALGLFSSRRAAVRAAEHVRAAVDFPLYCQGEDQLPTLLELFQTDPHACLFGTLSLWQGVDVPGDTCRLVTIDRIPFPRPDDPVLEARSELVAARGGNAFMSVTVPYAALKLAQGAGRLIRRADDRGVVALLDPRIDTARYGSYFRRSLPEFWVTRELATVKGALARLADTATKQNQP